MHYIIQLLNEIKHTCQTERINNISTKLSIFDLIKISSEEINKLDVLLLPPSLRFNFTIVRQEFRNTANSGVLSDRKNLSEMCGTAIKIINEYGANGSQKNNKNFSFITDIELRKIILRDYDELNNKLIPDRAWKSSVVLAGSILEAILFDLLESPRYHTQAIESPKAPKKNGSVIDLKEKPWNLEYLILVSEDIGLLPNQRAKSIDQVLRDFRNFVHPKKELRSKFPCTEAEAYLAKGALDAVLNHIESLPV